MPCFSASFLFSFWCSFSSSMYWRGICSFVPLRFLFFFSTQSTTAPLNDGLWNCTSLLTLFVIPRSPMIVAIVRKLIVHMIMTSTIKFDRRYDLPLIKWTAPGRQELAASQLVLRHRIAFGSTYLAIVGRRLSLTAYSCILSSCLVSFFSFCSFWYSSSSFFV